jgi:purine-binding chemotaxis protein CheW
MRRQAVTDAAAAIAQRAGELRREFDRSFASPPPVVDDAREDMLAIRLSGRSFALRLKEIAGLFVDKRITPVPGAMAALLGLAGFRGAIVPVYDLQALAGQSAAQASRWLFVAAAAPVAFSFEAFEGQLRVSPDAIAPQDRGEAHAFTRDFVRSGSVLRPIIHLSSALDAIKAKIA